MPYVGFLHMHTTVVILYLLFFLYKCILLFADQKERLEKFNRSSRVWGNMILPTLFLVLGVILWIKNPSVGNESWFIGKLVIMLAAIALGVVAFKKFNKGLAAISLLMFIYIYGVSETKSLTFKKPNINEKVEDKGAGNEIETGREIYLQADCKTCHGDDGKLQLMNAPDLTKTDASPEYMKNIIRDGKGTMPGHSKESLNDENLNKLIIYLQSIKK